MIGFVLISAIPVIILGAFTYRICSEVILEMAEEAVIDSIDSVCSDIETLFKDTHSTCVMVGEDINMQQYMRKSFYSIREQYSTDLKGSMELAYISAYKENIFGLYVLGNNGGKYKSNSASLHIQDFSVTPWYKEIMEGDNSVWFAAHDWSFVVRTIHERFITVGIPFTDKATGIKKGVIVAEIREETVKAIIDKGPRLNGTIIILDENNGIVTSSSTGSYKAAPVESGKIISKIESFEYAGQPEYGASKLVPDDELLLVYRPLKLSGWKIVSVVNKNTITDRNQIIAWSMAALLIMVLIISVMVAASISKTFTRPLLELAGLMEQVKSGDLTVRMNIKRRDEIGVLAESFNHMLTEMQALVKQIYEEQRKIRDAELKALQSQITPHFLYNSLDSITWLLRLAKIEEATKMLTALSSLFSIALSKGREVISIEEEIQHVSSFLVIESMIYSKKFDYSIEVDPEVKKYKTLKLLLQPLVENSIYHGIKPSLGKEFIFISVMEEGSEIVMTVQDTGIGIDPETLARLKAELDNNSGEHPVSKGFGLRNVNERIRVFYGRSYRLNIESRAGKGTEITIRIPKIEEEETIV